MRETSVAMFASVSTYCTMSVSLELPTTYKRQDGVNSRVKDAVILQSNH